MTGRWRVLVLVALLGAPLAACSDDGPGEGEARLEVNGQATVERADGDRETVDDSTDLGRGDRVSVIEGVAVMRLHGGATFELRRPRREAADTTVVMGSPPVLEAGDLLVTTPDSTTVEADGTEVQVSEGAARVTRAFGMSASAYDADLELDSAGVPAEVPALRQMVVPDLGRPRPAATRRLRRRPIRGTAASSAPRWPSATSSRCWQSASPVACRSAKAGRSASSGSCFPGLEDEDALERRRRRTSTAVAPART